MKPIELLQAAGFVEPSVIQQETLWDLVEVKSRDLFASAHLVLVLRAHAGWATLEKAGKAIRSVQAGRPLHVVVQRSCRALVGTRWDDNRRRIVKDLSATDAYTNQQLLAEAAKRTIGSLGEQEPEAYFIEPYLTAPAGNEAPALDFLRKWVVSEDATSRIAVLVAPAGAGKTTVARQLAYDLTSTLSAVRIPLVVESGQWANLPGASLTLWDIWKRAFEDNYDHVLTERDFCAFVENGCLVPILDGFDELCTRRAQDFDPVHALEALQALTEEDDARLILTTRDAFWSELPETLRRRTLELRLQQFNGPQVDRYIEQRFAFPEVFPRRAVAKRIIQRLQTTAYPARGQRLPPYETRLWSVPLIVFLVCESADSSAADVEEPYGAILADAPLTAIFLMLCAREKLRRQLQMSADDQMRLFRTIAIELAPVFSARDIEDVCEVEFSALPIEQRELLRSHALLNCLPEDQWTFRFDFLRDHLRAEGLREVLTGRDPSTAGAQLVRLLAPEANGQGAAVEHFIRAVAQGGDSWQRHVRSALGALTRLRSGVLSQQMRRAQSALLHIAIRMAEQSSISRKERTAEIQSIFGEHPFRQIYIEGPVVGLDLTTVRFEECEFRDAGFRNCQFSESTAFIRCRFVGTFDGTACEGLVGATLDNCEYSTDAREFFLTLRGSDRTPVDRDHVVEILAAVLRRFWSHGHFKTLTERDALRGPAGRSPLGRSVEEELLKETVLYHHTISGVGKDAGLAVSKEGMAEVRAFLDNRVLGRRLSPVVDRLCDRWCVRA
jgi:hypothetical protein